MTKLDLRKTMYNTIDTETCPIVPSEKVDAHNMLVYDIGWRNYDKQNNAYITRSFIVEEIFYGEKEKMASSYYADKLPQYYKDIEDGKRIVKPFDEIVKIYREDLKKYNVKHISAHNAYFDYTALRTTAKYLNAKYQYFFPREIALWDTMKMARDTICKNKTYQYFTAKGLKSAKAEHLYKYISQNENFKESHTGLEDTEIESEILLACLRSHKKMRKNLWANQRFFSCFFRRGVVGCHAAIFLSRGTRAFFGTGTGHWWHWYRYPKGKYRCT